MPHLDFGGVEKHMEIISSFSGYSKYKHVFLVIGNGGTAEDKIKNPIKKDNPKNIKVKEKRKVGRPSKKIEAKF